jgi:anti-sigma B factor antagonist
MGQELLSAPERSAGKILLNFQDVEFIYSALLGKLVALRRGCKKSKTDLKLCNIRPVIMDVMKVARFDEIFDVYASEQEALAAY